jgi:hypothetical protein
MWASASPKFIMGGSDEEKFDHPTQKPVDLRQPTHPQPLEVRRTGLRAVPGKRHYTGRRGIDRARLLRDGARPEVCGRHRAAMANPQRQQSQAGRRRAHFRRDHRGAKEGCRVTRHRGYVLLSRRVEVLEKRQAQFPAQSPLRLVNVGLLPLELIQKLDAVGEWASLHGLDGIGRGASFGVERAQRILPSAGITGRGHLRSPG